MGTERIKRLNSLLREVIADVIRLEVKNPHISPLFSIMEVDISKDLHHAKVHVSVIGTAEEREKTIQALNQAAGFIAVKASSEVIIRFFPALTFVLDETVDKQMHIQQLVEEVQKERDTRDGRAS
ncbi:MAG: 30S ribosome-binding factor RbfA [Verrucomicrobia bacterium]|nr:30S ribosome-binding factor RbfA [Verrucomicrobiota bacterium]